MNLKAELYNKFDTVGFDIWSESILQTEKNKCQRSLVVLPVTQTEITDWTDLSERPRLEVRFSITAGALCVRGVF